MNNIGSSAKVLRRRVLPKAKSTWMNFSKYYRMQAAKEGKVFHDGSWNDHLLDCPDWIGSFSSVWVVPTEAVRLMQSLKRHKYAA